MIFLIVSVITPLVLWILSPWIIKKITAKTFERDKLLLCACVCFLVSWYLPSPLIHGTNTQFMTHLIGGGIFTGFLWLSIKKQLHWRSRRLIEFMSLFALVSSLGVINELFELITVETHLTRLIGTDTWWDLLANTLGACFFWLAYETMNAYRRTRLLQN